MKVKLLGFKKIEFDPDKGKAVKGTSIVIAYPDRTFEGMNAKKYFVQDEDFKDLIGIDLKAFVGKDVVVDVDLAGKLNYVSA